MKEPRAAKTMSSENFVWPKLTLPLENFAPQKSTMPLENTASGKSRPSNVTLAKSK